MPARRDTTRWWVAAQGKGDADGCAVFEQLRCEGVKEVKPSSVPLFDKNRAKIFVGGLPKSISKQTIRTYFSSFGTVKTIKIVYTDSGGFCFVTFSSREEAEEVYKNREYNRINGKWVDCQPAFAKGAKCKGKLGEWPLASQVKSQLSQLHCELTSLPPEDTALHEGLERLRLHNAQTLSGEESAAARPIEWEHPQAPRHEQAQSSEDDESTVNLPVMKLATAEQEGPGLGQACERHGGGKLHCPLAAAMAARDAAIKEARKWKRLYRMSDSTLTKVMEMQGNEVVTSTSCAETQTWCSSGGETNSSCSSIHRGLADSHNSNSSPQVACFSCDGAPASAFAIFNHEQVGCSSSSASTTPGCSERGTDSCCSSDKGLSDSESPKSSCQGQEPMAGQSQLQSFSSRLQDLLRLLPVCTDGPLPSAVESHGLNAAAHLQQIMDSMHLIQQRLERLNAVEEVVDRKATCAVSLEVARVPMLGPDGQTYEKECIDKWLPTTQTSPVTRLPMRRSQMLRNLPLEAIMEVLYPSFEKRSQAEETASAEEALDNLLGAIHAGNEEGALAWLPAITEAQINFVFGPQRTSLLHLAVIHNLPTLAMVLFNHAEFKQGGALLRGEDGRPTIGVLHLAAAQGYSLLCEAYAARFGSLELEFPALSDSVVRLGSEEVLFKWRCTPSEIARLRGHYIAVLANIHDGVQ